LAIYESDTTQKFAHKCFATIIRRPCGTDFSVSNAVSAGAAAAQAWIVLRRDSTIFSSDASKALRGLLPDNKSR